MNITILTDPLYSDVPGGIGRYVKELIKNLAKIDSSSTYFLINSYRHKVDDILNSKHDNFKTIAFPLPRRLLYVLWLEFGIPRIESFTGKIDILHTPCPTIPGCKAKLVVTIHDLSFLKFREIFSNWSHYYQKRSLQICSSKATAIIAVSTATKNDILKYTGISEERIVVIHEGVNSHFHPITEQALIKKTRDKYQLSSPYILFVGTLEPRKNIHRLIEAFSELIYNGIRNYQLVIAGKRGWFYKDIFKKVVELKLQEYIEFIDSPPDEDIPILMSGASLFVYPSLYEGFGLPPLEAMACGIPVVTSNVSSLPEVVGDAAILVNPMNTKELAEGMNVGLNDKTFRQHLIEKGIKRARLFSWEAMAKKTLSLYKNL